MADEAAVVRKIDLRLLPFLWILYLVNFLDRANLGNVHTSMIRDLGLTEMEYTLGVGIFFVGYVIFEIPSNLMLKKATPSRWLARIMVSWGIISVCMMFITDFAGLMVTRFLLGIMEAGFFPGVIFYLTFWYKKEEQAMRQSLFFTASSGRRTWTSIFKYFLGSSHFPPSPPPPALLGAGAISGLLAYGLLRLEGVGGLAGWQYVFLIEGIPAIILGVLTWFVLPDSPKTAKFLTADERELAAGRVSPHVHTHSFSRNEFIGTFTNPQTWLFVVVYIAVANPSYGLLFFLPALIQQFDYDALVANLLTVPVYAVAAICTLLVAYHSDRRRERPLHVIGCMVVAAVGYFVLGFLPHMAAYFAIIIAASANFPAIILTLTWLTNTMEGSTRGATVTALVISLGNLGAFISNKIPFPIEDTLYFQNIPSWPSPF